MKEKTRNLAEKLSPFLKKAKTWRIVIVVICFILGVLGMGLDINKSVLGYSIFWYSFSMIIRSLGSELAGIVVGVVAIDYFNERRQIEQLRERLKRDLKSSVRDVAVSAIDELRELGWLNEVFQEGEKDFHAVQWEKANLQRANLFKANLKDADLTETNLSESELIGAVLRSTKLKGANLQGCNLFEAELSFANMNGSHMGYAKLRKAFMDFTQLNGADLSYADLRETNLNKARLNGVNLIGAKLNRSNLCNAHLNNACASNALFYGAILFNVDLKKADLSGADLRATDLRKSNLQGVDLCGANLNNAKLQEADLQGATLIGADLTGANLSGVKNLTDMHHRQVKSFEGAIMPDSTKYDEWVKIHGLKPELNNGHEPAQTLSQHVKEVAKSKGIHQNAIFAMLRKEFEVSSYKDIEDGQLEKAHNFLNEIDRENVG